MKGFVFDRPEYTGEEGFISAEERAKLSGVEAEIAKEKNNPEAGILRTEKIKEIDPAQLRPGMKVKLRNIDSEEGWFIRDFYEQIVVIEEVQNKDEEGIDTISFRSDGESYYAPCAYIESIISDNQQAWDKPYAKPQQVKALWLGQTEGDVDCETFQGLFKNKYVGAVIDSERYILHTSGSDMGIAIQACGQWAPRTEQEKYNCQYYIFPSARDLYLWMAEGEE